MEHSFNTAIAKKYGMKAAAILKNLYFWIEKNKVDGKHFHDGKFWTFGSIESFCELFDYLSKNEIYNALKKLKDENIIITGNYNKSAYDRTTWYALTDFGISLLSQDDTHFVAVQNGSCPRTEPIPDINTDINTDIKKEGANAPTPDSFNEIVKKTKRFEPPTLEAVRVYCKARENNIDPEAFCDYYAARGWTLSNGKKVQDWRACVRTWEKKNFDSGGNAAKKKANTDYIQGTKVYTDADLFPDVFRGAKDG